MGATKITENRKQLLLGAIKSLPEDETRNSYPKRKDEVATNK